MTAAAGIPTGTLRPRDLAAVAALPEYAQAWPLADCMRPDFVAGVEITHTLPGLREDASSGASAVRGLAGRCRRSVEVVLGAQAPGDCAALRAALRRLTQAPCSVPLWSEMTELTAPVVGGLVDTVFCDPSWRLFAPGQRVMLVDAEAAAGPFGASAHPGGEALRGMAWPYFELHTIKAGVTAGGGAVRTDRVLLESADLTEPILRSFRAGARLVPMLDVELATVVEVEQITARHMRARVSLRERGPSGPTASALIGLDASATGPFIPPLTAFGAAPAGAPTVDGLPLLDLRFQAGRTRGAFARDAVRGDGAVRVGPSVRGSRARERLGVECLGFSRERARRLLQFFESRGGQTLPFYVAVPAQALRLAPSSSTTLSGTTVNVERTGHALREPDAVFGATLPEWLVVETRDPGTGAYTRYARRVIARADVTQGGAPGGPVERLTLGEALPAIPRDRIVALAWAIKARFAGDALVEQWIDGRHARSALTLEEALDERSVDTLTVRAAAEPCAECLTDLGDLCPGSAAWVYPIPLVGAGSDEAAACALDDDNDLVLDAGATVRVAGAFRYLSLDTCGSSKKVEIAADAMWDVALPGDASIYPATDRHRLDSGDVELAPSASAAHRWLGAYSECAGPVYVPGLGNPGVLSIRTAWYNGQIGGTGVRLWARVAGLKHSGDSPFSGQMWYVEVICRANGTWTLGGGIGADAFSPFFVPWSARVASRRGITAIAASFVRDYGGGSGVQFTLTAHVCRVLACAEAHQ